MKIHIQHLVDDENPRRTACGEVWRPSNARRGERVKFCPDCRKLALTPKELK